MLVLHPVGFPSCQSRAAFSSLLFLGLAEIWAVSSKKSCTTPTSCIFCWCWWMWGWSFSFLLHEAGPGHLHKVKVSKEGSPNGTCLPGTHSALPQAWESAAQPLWCSSVYALVPRTGFLGCQKLIPKTRLTGDTARTACCLLPLLPPLPFAAETK